MTAIRHLRLLGAFARVCLVRDISFRANFAVRVVGGLLWISLLVFFFDLVFRNTAAIGDWSRDEYFYFLGTSFLLNALTNGLFLVNCTELAELIRTGDLDQTLLKPVDEQFLVSCRQVDWAELPKALAAVGLLVYAAVQTGRVPTVAQVGGYCLLLACGLAVFYSLMIALAASSVWIVRSSGLYELWFYVTQFSRYPRDIYSGNWLGLSLNYTLTFAIPILLAMNVPARWIAGLTTETHLLVALATATAVSLTASRWFFRFALSKYGSASS